MGKEKRIFIAATRQNDGKTMVSLGLMQNFKTITPHIGFIKPVGQRYVEIEGVKVDEDAVLMRKICGAGAYSLKDMNPISVPRGFTEEYLDRGRVRDLIAIIERSYQRCAEGKELVMIEGTGHAGVGSVFDLSNARVAKILNSKVLLISLGGIGRPIDEIMLNKALFEKEGVELIGVVVNKVLPDKMEKIREYVKKGLKRKGVDLLGIIPYRPSLTSPTVEQVKESLNLRLLCGEEFINNVIEGVVVGAMTPHHAIRYIKNGSLVITPGDREDLILGVLSLSSLRSGHLPRVAGLVLTGGLKPYRTIMRLMKRTEIPVLSAQRDTYTITSAISDLVVKIREVDKGKIYTARRLVRDHVDVQTIYERIN